jgi:hypothetical protein
LPYLLFTTLHSFTRPQVSAANHQRLGRAAQAYEKAIMAHADRVHFIVQDQQEV